MLVENLEKMKVSTSYSALLIARCPQFFRCHDNVPNANLPNNTCANKKINEILQKVFLKNPFNVSNLLMLAISQSVWPWQAFPA
jgi:hypothetical protein